MEQFGFVKTGKCKYFLERIEQIIKRLENGDIVKFAKKLNLNAHDVKKSLQDRQGDIFLEHQKRIFKAYPDLWEQWFLTGQRSMLLSDMPEVEVRIEELKKYYTLKEKFPII